MDPVGHILEIFEIFGLGIGIGHSGRLYGSGPDGHIAPMLYTTYFDLLKTFVYVGSKGARYSNELYN